MGVRTIGDLATVELEVLVNKFGKAGNMLYEYSRGLDSSPVLAEDERSGVKSISNGFTFRHDLTDREQCKTAIIFLTQEIGFKLRAQGLKCSTVVLTVKDIYLKSVQRQRPLSKPSDIESEIADTAYRLLVDTWPDKKPIRMITVSVTGLSDSADSAEQIDMFADEDTPKREKNKKREEAVDKLRQKYGSNALMRASFIGEDIGISPLDDED